MSNLKNHIKTIFYRVNQRSIYESSDLRNMWRNKTKTKIAALAAAMYLLLMISGVGDYLLTKKFEDNFDYPLNVDVKPLVKQILMGKSPYITPINYYPFNFMTNWKCGDLKGSFLVILVKSAMHHFSNRAAIRATFGQSNVVPGMEIKTVFFVGIDENYQKPKTQKKIEEEMLQFKDIIQMDFHDDYFNNTIKTMMMFKWAFENCYSSHFYLFTDDDMYISVPNLIDYVNKEGESYYKKHSDNSTKVLKGNIPFYAGFVFKSAPLRFRSSKWRVSLSEYPWDRWPPYITAGAYVVSNRSLRDIYVASFFVRHFRFDDIYLGIVAKKLDLNLTHCEEFYYYKKQYTKEGYRDVIASHGYSDHAELIAVWNEQMRIRYHNMPLQTNTDS